MYKRLAPRLPLKALSHWQYFVLHNRATQLINTFLLSKTFAQTGYCCMQVLHKGVIDWRIELHYGRNVQSFHASIAQRFEEYWLIEQYNSETLSHGSNTKIIGLRHSLNKKFSERLCCTNWNSVNSCNNFVQFPIHFHYHLVSGIYQIKDCPISFGDWYIY